MHGYFFLCMFSLMPILYIFNLKQQLYKINCISLGRKLSRNSNAQLWSSPIPGLPWRVLLAALSHFWLLLPHLPISLPGHHLSSLHICQVLKLQNVSEPQFPHQGMHVTGSCPPCLIHTFGIPACPPNKPAPALSTIRGKSRRTTGPIFEEVRIHRGDRLCNSTGGKREEAPCDTEEGKFICGRHQGLKGRKGFRTFQGLPQEEQHKVGAE